MSNQYTIPAGTVLKLGGLPYELKSDAIVSGESLPPGLRKPLRFKAGDIAIAKEDHWPVLINHKNPDQRAREGQAYEVECSRDEGNGERLNLKGFPDALFAAGCFVKLESTGLLKAARGLLDGDTKERCSIPVLINDVDVIGRIDLKTETAKHIAALAVEGIGVPLNRLIVTNGEIESWRLSWEPVKKPKGAVAIDEALNDRADILHRRGQIGISPGPFTPVTLNQKPLPSPCNPAAYAEMFRGPMLSGLWWCSECNSFTVHDGGKCSYVKHPKSVEDSAEPITEDWLLGFGFQLWAPATCSHLFSLGRLRIQNRLGEYSWFYADQWEPLATRRDVRLLCELLRIELKEAV